MIRRDNRKNSKKGFTLVELMLAMAFISGLLLAIAVMTISMTTMYTKGNTMKELNSAGRTINDDFTHTFNSTTATLDWPTKKNSYGLGASYVEKAENGAFCTGEYSYLWNSANGLRDESDSSKLIQNSEGIPIRLVKMSDSNKFYCQNDFSGRRIPEDGLKVDLLPISETGLMIHAISFSSNDGILRDSATNQRLINISYVLGTKNDGSITAMSCDPTQAGLYQEYCAINKFELTVRTLGKK